jgi:hypothetical protein
VWCADTPLQCPHHLNRLAYFYLGLKYHCWSSGCPTLSLINSLFWCSINHTGTMEQNGFVVTFKGDVIELRNDIGPLMRAVSNGNELCFVLWSKCSRDISGWVQTAECSNHLLDWKTVIVQMAGFCIICHGKGLWLEDLYYILLENCPPRKTGKPIHIFI